MNKLIQQKYLRNITPNLQHGFTNAQLASPVSEFMNNSPAVYTNMLMNSASWVVPNTQYDLANPSVAVLQSPLNKVFSINNTSFGVPFLSTLFGNPNPSMNQYALSLMCHTGDMTLINGLAVLMGRPTGQDCNTEAASLRPYLPAAGSLMGMFHTLQQQHPTQFLSYMTTLTTDAALYADQYYAASLPPKLQPIVNAYGVKSRVTAFFDSWSGAHAELTSVNSTSSLLQVKYNESTMMRACPVGSGYPLLLLAGYAQGHEAAGYPLLSLTQSPRPPALCPTHCLRRMCCRKTTITLPSMTSTVPAAWVSSNTIHHSSMPHTTIQPALQR